MNDFQTKLAEKFKEFFPGWIKDIITIEPDAKDEYAIIVALKFGVKRFGELKNGEIFMETL